MRIIRFRGKRLDNSEWVYGFAVVVCGLAYIKPWESFVHDSDTDMPYCFLYKVDPSTIGQFTGLKDKNGKEIYEGDILRISGEYFRKTIQTDMSVEYDTSRAWFGILDALHTVSLNTFNCEDDCEVIGNTHDSLKVSNN